MEAVEIDKIELLFRLNVSAFNLASLINASVKLFDFNKTKKARIKNATLLSKKKSDRCFIVGLGPSLNDVDLSKINSDTIVVNHFYKIGQNIDFSPTIYFAVDNAFSTEDHINSIYEAIELYKGKTTFVFSDKIANKINHIDDIELHTVVGGGKLFNASANIDFTKRYPIGFNVLADAIMLALYMGYSEIILLGADFNSFASRKSIHAYQEEDDDRKIELWKELFCYSIVAYVHKELDKYSKKKDVKIINATKASLIDSYQYNENFIYINNIAKNN